jgi:hypothetical protein
MLNRQSATALDALVIFILSTSFVSVSLLVLSIFSVQLSLFVSGMVMLSIYWVTRNRWRLNLSILKNHVIPITILI